MLVYQPTLRENITSTTFGKNRLSATKGRPDAFMWEGPDRAKLMVYYLGDYRVWTLESYEEVIEKLPGMLEELEKKEYSFDAIRYAYNGYDNCSPNIYCCYIPRERNKQ